VIAGGLVVLAVAAGLVWLFFLRDNSLEVTIRNESGSAIDGLSLVSNVGAHTSVPPVAVARSVSVRPALGGGEANLALVDAQGRRYLLLGYFEGDPGGKVTVTIAARSPKGLVGDYDDETHYSPAGQQKLEVFKLL
jgi:hypothetical protein